MTDMSNWIKTVANILLPLTKTGIEVAVANHRNDLKVREELNRRRMTLRASDSVIVNSGSLSQLESLTDVKDVKVIVGGVNIPASLRHSLMDLAPLQPGDISIRSMADMSRDSTVDNPGSLKQMGPLADVGGMKVIVGGRTHE